MNILESLRPGANLDAPDEPAAPVVESSSPPAPDAPASPSSGLWGDLYAARTASEGVRAIFRVVPPWVPAVGVASGLGVYYVVFRVRLFLAQWRIAERQRAERKYDLLENLRGVSIGPVGAVEPLADDADDDEEEEEDDETAVSTHDVEEFRSSLGIRLPRDEDLLAIVERMLMMDPIPDGWVLYRTTAGIIRFMNLNTQELFFFHPGKRKEKTFIEEELKKRNRQAMESKYSFSYEDEGMNSDSISGRSRQSLDTGAPRPSPIDFGDSSTTKDEDEAQSSTFKRMFNYFLEKEQKRIEQEVARSRGATGARAGTSSGTGAGAAGGSGTPRGGSNAGNNTGSSPVQRTSGGGSGQGEPGKRAVSASSTYRVVSSSVIHGSRGGSVQ